MVKEEAMQIKDVNNSNQEKKNNAKSENIPEEFTEKFVVKKGKGTPLKDICDVVSQLENKVLSFSTTLHCILYGEHDEVEDFKKDVLEFSGFVSDGDEESQRDKVKERLERCTREMLTQLCSVFDIPSRNAFYGKNKKEIIELLLDFLEAPHDAATEETESSHREVYRNYFYLCCC
ncbi:DEK domain-containing chromatin-associated protein 3-like [Carex rostrata]